MSQTDTSAEPDARLCRFSMSDGLSIAAEVYGPDDGSPVLLAHGGGQTRYAWTNVARRLGALGWKAVAIDLRGHGESDWSKVGDYSHERYALDLVEVVRHIGGRPVLVGASLGGNSGMLAAGTIGRDAFRALVLVDVTPKLDPEGMGKVLGFLDQHIDAGFCSFEEAAQAISDYLPGRRGRQNNIASLGRYLRRREDGRYGWHWDPAFVRGVKNTRLSPDRIARISDAVRATSIPMMLIRGSDSELVNRDAVEHFLELAPHAEFRDVLGASHMIVGDRNDIFAGALTEFLDTVEDGTARTRAET
jgi:pimeloyl-ACP methyl ester carboxylesterase